MIIEFKETTLKEWEAFNRYGNKTLINKIKNLLKEIESHPETGTGKPERLRGDLSGFWSRRINREHRIIYEIDNENEIVRIYSLKGHYEKK